MNPNSPVSLASSVDQTLCDALHRSWVVRTLFSDGKEATGQAANQQKDDHDYRLPSVLAGPEGEDLYLTLWDNRTNSRLWTGNVGLSGQEDNIGTALRSEEHTSVLQLLLRITYAVCCLNTTSNINMTS